MAATFRVEYVEATHPAAPASTATAIVETFSECRTALLLLGCNGKPPMYTRILPLSRSDFLEKSTILVTILTRTGAETKADTARSAVLDEFSKKSRRLVM